MLPESIIRRRFRRRPMVDNDLTLPLGVAPFNPDAGILRPRTSVASVSPLTRNPVATNPTPEIITRQPLPQEPMPQPITPIFNNKGRPTGVEGGVDPVERQQALLREQQNYQAPISKKDIALQALFGFLQGGIPGAIGNTARYGLDQGYRNQVVMGRGIDTTQRQLQQELITRNQSNDLLNDQSTRGYRDAQSKALITRANQPPKSDSKFVERADGVYEISSENPDGRKVGNIPAEAKTKNANPTRYFERPDGVYGVNDEHPEGFKVKGVPGTPEKGDDPEFNNSLIGRNITEAQKERDGIGASLKTIPAMIETVKTDPYTLEQSKVMAPNPAYADLMDRYRKLDDNIRDWRTKQKPITRNSSASGKKWSAARWKAANPNGDLNAARAAAKAAGASIVD